MHQFWMVESVQYMTEVCKHSHRRAAIGIG